MILDGVRMIVDVSRLLADCVFGLVSPFSTFPVVTKVQSSLEWVHPTAFCLAMWDSKTLTEALCL